MCVRTEGPDTHPSCLQIFGPICVAGYWRSRTNEEVRQLYGELDIVTNKKRNIEMAGTCEDE